MNSPFEKWNEDKVREDLQRQPHILMALAGNALTVAESLRGNYFKNTARFIHALRTAIRAAESGRRQDQILARFDVGDAAWSEVQQEVVTFIDGGVGQVRVSGQVPILLRVGSYSVRTGERTLAEREQFGYYPVILGDLEGGSKERRDFVDIVRVTAELLGGLAALERTPDLGVLMFHGPLIYLVYMYAGHTPFTERDIDLFLRQYGPRAESAAQLKADFLREAALDIYPAMTARSDDWVRQRLFEPLSWMAFLYRRLVSAALSRSPRPIIAGVAERGELREFSEQVLLPRVFRGLRQKGNTDYFNRMFGRRDLSTPKSLLDRLGYSDAILLAMLLDPGQHTEPWSVRKFDRLEHAPVVLPGEVDAGPVDFSILKPPGRFGFPAVQGCYLKVSETTEPIRVEVFEPLGPDQVGAAARRAYLYARLLPGYGFPVGLDIADKFAKVPAWMTDAYGKLIRLHLAESLQRGEIDDQEMRRILVQAIYLTHRDWLFRPQP